MRNSTFLQQQQQQPLAAPAAEAAQRCPSGTARTLTPLGHVAAVCRRAANKATRCLRITQKEERAVRSKLNAK